MIDEWITAGECVQELYRVKDWVGASESSGGIMGLAEVDKGGKSAWEDKQGGRGGAAATAFAFRLRFDFLALLIELLAKEILFVVVLLVVLLLIAVLLLLALSSFLSFVIVEVL